MKSSYLKELQSKLLGSVIDSDDARAYYATDSSIFTVTPEAIVYPRNTADVRKTLQYLTERANAGKKVSLTARGRGTDQSGGALGDGLQLVFPAHMNRLLKMEKDTVTIQPGILYSTLQQTLHTHGRFLPPYPASIDYSTVGGAIANNASGEKSYKYGPMRNFVKHLKVVLADGSLIEAKRISARELNRKKGQADLEGSIYRKLDALIVDNAKLIGDQQPKTAKNTAGYALNLVKGKDGSFDLSQILIGSQGTLAVITEATIKTAAWNPRSTLIVANFDEIEAAVAAIKKLKSLKPSAIEVVDFYLLDHLRHNRPQELEGLIPEKIPQIVVLIEFDNFSQIAQALATKRAERILAKHTSSVRISTDPVEQEALWKIRRSATAAIWMGNGPKKALPFIDDACVPVDKLPEFFTKTYKLLAKHKLEIAIWGHAGDGNLHIQPFVDLTKKKEVDDLFTVADEFTDLVVKLGGTTTGEHNDGIMRGPYHSKVYGKELAALFTEVKDAFDPQRILNPLVKTEVTEEFRRAHVREEYSLNYLYDHLPHN